MSLAALSSIHPVRPVDQRPPWEDRPAAQQPEWRSHPDFERVHRELRARRSLTDTAEIDALAGSLAEVAQGRAQVLQLGDCAEGLDDCGAVPVAAKLDLLEAAAARLERDGTWPVVRIGRMGGQMAKPRSNPTEVHDGVEIPAFRGHLINGEEATPDAREHDPWRMLSGYTASARVHAAVGRRRGLMGGRPPARGPWTSHEALVLDYEGALVRADDDGSVLTSTHFPWVGERTRQPGGGHAALLASVANPVGAKVGPSVDVDDLLELCDVLDPWRTPGRLTLITRFGHQKVGGLLRRVIDAVAEAGHPVVWICDPMHGNTSLREGVKTRYVDSLCTEVAAFRAVLAAAGQHAGGLHLEAASHADTECVGHGVGEDDLGENYRSLCDPRLNPEQVHAVISAWLGC